MIKMTHKRAVLYIRVSSEAQAKSRNKKGAEAEEKVSPKKQEARCREYCEAKGYRVVAVYRDIEKYRVGKRLVEPSGTRADRPQLRRMLADADAGGFDMIIAWREDRLYRSYRPMLDVLECIERNGIAIELTNDSFDARFAPIKAWAAKMELEAKHERFMMGVAGRIESGKVWNNPPMYGWQRIDGVLLIDPVEAEVVRQIWKGYADGLSAREIRRRLIAMGARERHEGNKTPWSTSYLYKILHTKTYYTGDFKTAWSDAEIRVPPIIDLELAEQVKAKLKRKQNYPARHLVYNYLGAGLVYCEACDVRMTARTVNRRERKNGIRSEYSCFRSNMGHQEPGCCKTVSVRLLDPLIWDKVWSFVAKSGKFEEAIEARVAALKTQEINAQAECERLKKKLDDLVMERQKVITQWRKGKMTDADYDLQLGALTIEQESLERELRDKQLLVGNRAERLMEAARIYREEVRHGAQGLNAIPQTPEHAEKQFKLRRKFIEGIVTRIDLRPKHDITVHYDFDFAKLLSDVQNSAMAAS